MQWSVQAAPGPSAVHLFQFLPRAGQDGMKFEMTGQMTGDSVKHTTQQQQQEEEEAGAAGQARTQAAEVDHRRRVPRVSGCLTSVRCDSSSSPNQNAASLAPPAFSRAPCRWHFSDATLRALIRRWLGRQGIDGVEA